MANCPACGSARNPDRIFCSCGKLLDREVLESIRLPGEVGVQKLEKFWATGDPQYA
jgi:hypothetical protein